MTFLNRFKMLKLTEIMDYLCTCKSEMKWKWKVIVFKQKYRTSHHTNGRFDWLIAGHQSIAIKKKTNEFLDKTEDLNFSVLFWSLQTSTKYSINLLRLDFSIWSLGNRLVGFLSMSRGNCWSASNVTGWTNVNLFYFPDSTEIASLEGLTLWFSDIN